MAGRNCLLIFIFLIQLFIGQIENSKLNVPRILLPLFNDLSVNFTLEVTDGGCYKWSTSRLDLLQLLPLNLDEERGCSEAVIVTTISKDAVRNTAMILAEEVQTEQILRCDVILDVIDSLKIVTTTRELYMEEAPEAFEVRAYDDQGNEFSSLEGIPFHWSLLTHCSGKEKCGDSPVLRFLTFKESPYETPLSIQAFEDLGIQGHIVLLEGVKTGVAKVSVSLPQPEYKHIQCSEVILMIVANIIILPPEVHILPNGEIKFRVYRMYQNKLEEIMMPNNQYYFAVEDQYVARLGDNGLISGLKVGKTRITVNDKNMDPSESNVKLPSALLVVVYPAYLVINILPHRNWAVLLRDSHEIVVEAFCSQDHKIHLGDEVSVNIQIDTKYFQEKEKSNNGTWLLGYGIEPGFSPVHATLESVGTQRLEPRVSVRADLFIYPRIVLTPTEVILPWDPVVKPKYEVKLKATGGDGHFLWSTTNAAVAVVTQGGVVRTQSQGTVEISASMARNHHNRKTSKVYILPPIRLEIIEYILEAETNKPINLQIALYGKRTLQAKDEVPFTQCDEIPFKVTSSDENFFYNETRATNSVGTACTTIQIVGLVVGTSKITVSYEYQGVILEDSVTVSAFQPLSILQPVKAETVLAVGTSRNVILQGGPKPWIGRPAEHNRSVIAKSNHVEALDITELTTEKKADIFVIQVRCLAIGETTVEFSIVNTPVVTTSCSSVASIASIRVICSKPRIIRIKPEVEIVDANSCPMDLNSQKIAVHNYEDIEITLTVKDEHGRTFDNISSLAFNWQLVPSNGGSIFFKDGYKEQTFKEYNIELPKRYFQIIVPSKQNGNLDITVVVEGYKRDVLLQQGIDADLPELSKDFGCTGVCPPNVIPTIFTALTFFLVGDVEVSSTKLSIYNHPSNVQYLDIKQGSGYYELALSSKDIAHVKYNEGIREIEITPKATGELKISVTDICLPSRPTQILIQVVSVKSIKVDMPDRVEIGKCIKAIVKFYDDSDVLLPLPPLDLLELRSIIDSSIISVKQVTGGGNIGSGCTGTCLMSSKTDEIGEIPYIITGIELGETKISFTTGHGPRIVKSNPISIQVFRPIRVLPRNITLIVSSLLQLTYEGGPSPDANIDFITESNKIANVLSNGLIEAKDFGKTKITAQATGVNSCSGQKVLFSKDTIQVNVVKLTGIKIGAPLARFKVGTTVPVWALGIPEQITPLILGTTELPITYEWQVIPEEIAQVNTAFNKDGIKYSNTEQVTMQLKGLAAGRAKLTLIATVNSKMIGIDCGTKSNCKTKLEASLDIEIYEPLLVSPPSKMINQELLLAPYSTFQIASNKDRTCQVAYSVQQDISPGTIVANEKSLGFANVVVSVTPTGLVKSYGIYGRAVVIVTAVEAFGLKQTITVIVEVKPVHYMLAHVYSSINIPKGQHINVIPRGVDINLEITYHDNTGEQFIAVQNNLRIRTSRADLATVRRGLENTSLISNLQRPGNTILKIWDDAYSMRVMDYLKFHVGNVIKPESPKVTVGDVICFISPLIGLAGNFGLWSAHTPFLDDMKKDGIMVALKSRDRPITVSYSIDSEIQTTNDVQILPIGRIRFVTENTCACLSNSFRLSVEEIPLVLYGPSESIDKVTNLVTSGPCSRKSDYEITRFPYSCEIEFTNKNIDIDISDLFRVEPNFNFNTGQYSCKLITLRDSELNTSLLSNNITVRANANGIKDEAKLSFIPGVFIDNNNLYVSPDHRTGYILIHGVASVLSNLKVIPIDSDVLDVYHSSNPTYTSKRYDITLKNVSPKQMIEDKMGVMVISPLTKQKIKVNVKTDGAGFEDISSIPEWGSPLMETLWNFRQVFAISASIIGVFLASLYGYSNYVQPVINVNVQAARTPMMSGDGSPKNTSMYGYPGSGTGAPGPFSKFPPTPSPTHRSTASPSCYGAPVNLTPRRSLYTSYESPNLSNITPPRHTNYEELRNRAFK